MRTSERARRHGRPPGGPRRRREERLSSISPPRGPIKVAAAAGTLCSSRRGCWGRHGDALLFPPWAPAKATGTLCFPRHGCQRHRRPRPGEAECPPPPRGRGHSALPGDHPLFACDMLCRKSRGSPWPRCSLVTCCAGRAARARGRARRARQFRCITPIRSSAVSPLVARGIYASRSIVCTIGSRHGLPRHVPREKNSARPMADAVMSDGGAGPSVGASGVRSALRTHRLRRCRPRRGIREVRERARFGRDI